MGKKVGRPEKLNKELADKIAGLVRIGNYNYVAARACGISKATFYKWIEKGEEDKSKGKDTIYAYFSEAIGLAEAEAEVSLVNKWRMLITDNPDYKQIKDFLIARWKQRWGQQLEISGKVQLEEGVDEEHIEAIYDKLRDRLFGKIEDAGSMDSGKAHKSQRRED